jgi:hypothetical protein
MFTLQIYTCKAIPIAIPITNTTQRLKLED